MISFVVVLSVVAYMNTTDSQNNLAKSEESIRNSLIAKGKTLSKNNSQALKGMVEDNAFSAVQDLVSSTVRDDVDIHYGIFMDVDKLPWVYATLENPDGSVVPGEELTDEASEWAGSLESENFKIFSQNGDDMYEFASPVIVEEEILGVIRYGISTQSMRNSLAKAAEASQATLRNTLMILLGSVFAAMALGVFFTRKVAHTITWPLNLLQSAAGTIAGGNYDDEVTVTTNDEIGVLAENFEQMRSTIKKKMADLAKLNSTGEVLASLLDQSKALEVVLQTMHEQIGVSLGSVYLMNEDQELEVKAFFPPKMISEDVRPRKFSSGQGILGRAAKDKKVIFVPNTEEDTSFEEDNKQGKPRSLLCVPLMDKDIVIGVMNLSGELGEVTFEESDSEFVSSVARLLVITIKNIRMREVIEEQNRTLEHKVNERTAELALKTNDISNMLMNMHQGLFTVMEGGIIHHEYAAYLEQIFETEHIASRNFMDLLFSDTDLGSNDLDQVKTAIDALIGSDEMMFEFNSHLLVTEVTKTMGDGRTKILDFDWDPIVLDEEISKIMVTVRDVTAMKALQKEAEAQKKELEIIGQILNVGADKMAEFLKTSYSFITECRELIEATADKDLDVIATLFRNMHTIKGNARTYGFAYITDSVHEVESTYDELRKQEDKVWVAADLLDELLLAENDIKQYQLIAREKLGYDLEGNNNQLDTEQVERILEKIKALDTSALDKGAKDVIEDTYRLFISSEAQAISGVISGVVESVTSLAVEMDKSPPKINIDDGGILIKKDAYPMMTNIFMHVFRNAIDHGIEPDQEREDKGKIKYGEINLITELGKGLATIKIKDDGRGLAINKLFDKAVKEGMYEPDKRPDDIEIANLIFASGFSTAEKVTNVSGRGVGMDAVKQFLLKEGGGIKICLEDNNEGADFRAFSTQIDLPEKFFLKV